MTTGNPGQADFAGFLTLIASLGPQGSSIVPPADAQDAANGATQIPDAVTDARRAGQTVKFVQVGAKENWYWEMPGGKKILHG